MVMGDMPPLPSVRPRGPFCMPLRMSIKPIEASCHAGTERTRRDCEGCMAGIG